VTNEEMDTKVFEAIRLGHRTLRNIQAYIGIAFDRPIDRSLQRLRRRSLIKYGGPGTIFVGWRITNNP
jgi:hypothetical protein